MSFLKQRPTLKRSRTPYHPSQQSKRRRTSPTGAFSRLSLSNDNNNNNNNNNNNHLSSSTSTLATTPIQNSNDHLISLYQQPSQNSSLEITPQLAQRLAQREKDELLNQFIFNSHPLITHHHPSIDHQLVLYRKPIWPPPPTSQEDQDDQDDGLQPRFIQIDHHPSPDQMDID